MLAHHRWLTLPPVLEGSGEPRDYPIEQPTVRQRPGKSADMAPTGGANRRGNGAGMRRRRRPGGAADRRRRQPAGLTPKARGTRPESQYSLVAALGIHREWMDRPL